MCVDRRKGDRLTTQYNTNAILTGWRRPFGMTLYIVRLERIPFRLFDRLHCAEISNIACQTAKGARVTVNNFLFLTNN